MENLKKLRLQSNYTQKDVAKKLNIRQNTYSQYETGTREPSLDMLIKFARFFDTSTDFILGLTDEDEPYPYK